MFTPTKNNYQKIFFALFMAAGLVALDSARAQNLSKGNAFAQVVVNSFTGKFQIFGPQSNALTYPGDFTSHTNFVFTVAGAERIVTNENISGVQIHDGAVVAAYTPADSVYSSGDSIFAFWKNIFGYSAWQITYPFLTATSGQIAIAYRVEKFDPKTSNTFRGVLLELDVFVPTSNQQACQSGNDRALILDARGFHASPDPNSSACWIGSNAQYLAPNIPEWFHAGSFDAQRQPKATGWLWGASVETPLARGPTLTMPDEFVIGDWGDANASEGLKNVGWNVAAPDFAAPGNYTDCATIYKWNATTFPFYCATAYGPNDDSSQNAMCYSADNYVDVLFPKKINFDAASKTFSPAVDTIRVWAANTQHDGSAALDMNCVIDTAGMHAKLLSGELLKKQMIEVGGTSNTIPAGHSGYCEIYFLPDPGQLDHQSFPQHDSFSVNVETTKDPSFTGACAQTFDLVIQATGKDSYPPTMMQSGLNPAEHVFTIADNGVDDSGLDSIRIISQTNLQLTVPTFPHCSAANVLLTAAVIDTTQLSTLNIYLKDCAGNDTTLQINFHSGNQLDALDGFDTVVAVTSTINSKQDSDVTPPIVTSQFFCSSWRCVARDWDTASSGIQKMELVQNNFSNLSLAPGVPLHEGDLTANFGIDVIDPALPASGFVDVYDVAGNVSEYWFHYVNSWIRCSTDSIAFLGATINVTAIDTVLEITNISADTFSISSASILGNGAAQFSIISPKFPATIAAGDSIALALRWTNADSDSIHCGDAELHIAGCRDFLVAYLHGCNTSAQAKGTDLNSPLVCAKPGDSVSGSVTITSDGTGTLIITAISISGTDASNFKIDYASSTPHADDPAAAPWLMPPGTQEHVAILFSPKDTGVKNAQLMLTSNSDQPGKQVSNLSGTGLAPNSVNSDAAILRANDFSLQTFPTPATTDITLLVSGIATGNAQPARIMFDDLLGRTQKEFSAQLNASGQTQITFAKLDLQPGVWFVKVVAGARTAVSRVVIVKF